MSYTTSFKIGNKIFELFEGKDHIEIYEKDRPSNGIVLDRKEYIIPFVNKITDIAESLDLE